MPKMTLNSIHIVRDAELQTTLADPLVEMIVTIDQPGRDVHPPCKDAFGTRLAMLARKLEYGQSLVARFPFYNEAASYVAGTSIGVVFDNAAGGLASSGGALAEWEITDVSGSYVAANAVISGSDTVVVSSPSVPNPVSARYAYSVDPAANNLVNSAGLPASPIREVTPSGSGPVCGDTFCDPGEDTCNCAADCGSPPATEVNCSDGVDDDCDTDVDCDDADCMGDPACPFCGDSTCDASEDPCNCAADCGTPPANEIDCSDGIDEDCDGGEDCLDPDGDCDVDPSCQAACNNNGVCEAGEDCVTCPGDCPSRTNGPPSDRYCCGNGICEGDGNGADELACGCCPIDCGP